MEHIRLRFGETFLKVIANFCMNVTVSAESFAKTVVELGDMVDRKLGYESRFTATTIVDIISRNGKIRAITENLITLYGVAGLQILFKRFFPKSFSGNEVLFISNRYNDDYVIPPLRKDKPYQEYSDPKHRLPYKPIHGFRKQIKWNRTRSNPQLR